jgi:hypothetical protein
MYIGGINVRRFPMAEPAHCVPALRNSNSQNAMTFAFPLLDTHYVIIAKVWAYRTIPSLPGGGPGGG